MLETNNLQLEAFILELNQLIDENNNLGKTKRTAN